VNLHLNEQRSKELAEKDHEFCGLEVQINEKRNMGKISYPTLMPDNESMSCLGYFSHNNINF
jgi:hypothetical protein